MVKVRLILLLEHQIFGTDDRGRNVVGKYLWQKIFDLVTDAVGLDIQKKLIN